MGYVHSYETFTTVDGPGIRFILFLTGCPLRCKYCHNPDTWKLGNKNYTAQEIVDQILKYKNYYKNGGVTISGGEPLLQIDFVIEVLKLCKENNLHTAVDTSGITFDINNKEKHIELTGKSNKNIIDFAYFLDECHKKVWIRHVIVPTINTDEKNLLDTRKFLNTLHNIEKVEVLPYHTLGKDKYTKLGIKYPLEGIRVPNDEEISLARKILEK